MLEWPSGRDRVREPGATCSTRRCAGLDSQGVRVGGCGRGRVGAARHRPSVPPCRHRRRSSVRVFPSRPEAAAVAGRGAGLLLQRLLRAAGRAAAARRSERPAPSRRARADRRRHAVHDGGARPGRSTNQPSRAAASGCPRGGRRPRSRRCALAPATRALVRDGMRGAAEYGSALTLGSRLPGSLAKTGTAPMPGGRSLGLAVAFAPGDSPARAAVVAAPGGAGIDAAQLAGELLAAPAAVTAPNTAPTTAAVPPVATSAASAAVTDEALRSASRGRTIRVGVTARDGSVRPETIAVEEYVARVISGEGQPKAGPAAHEALAIVIRTFAAANQRRHRAEGYDLCDTTHCQVMRPAIAVARQAALGHGRPGAARSRHAGVRLLLGVVRRHSGAGVRSVAGRHRLPSRGARTTTPATTSRRGPTNCAPTSSKGRCAPPGCAVSGCVACGSSTGRRRAAPGHCTPKASRRRRSRRTSCGWRSAARSAGSCCAAPRSR